MRARNFLLATGAAMCATLAGTVQATAWHGEFMSAVNTNADCACVSGQPRHL